MLNLRDRLRPPASGQTRALDGVSFHDRDEVFALVGESLHVYHRYAHQLRGGRQQRVVIAMALASNPRLLVLDEPTTRLDAAVEAGVLSLIYEPRRERHMAVLFITHNLSIVARMTEHVGVRYAGCWPRRRVLERAAEYRVGLTAPPSSSNCSSPDAAAADSG